MKVLFLEIPAIVMVSIRFDDHLLREIKLWPCFRYCIGNYPTQAT